MAKTLLSPSLTAFTNQEFLRSSHFAMRFTRPSIFIGQELAKEVEMMCESVEFPGATATTTNYRMTGLHQIKVPYSREYPDVTFTLLHNTSHPVYQNFLAWVRFAGGEDYFNDSGVASKVPYYDELTTEINLFQLREIDTSNTTRFSGLSRIVSNIDKLNSRFIDSNKLFDNTRTAQSFISNFNAIAGVETKPREIYYNVQFFGAYPITVQSLQSNWGDDGFQKLMVTFAYEYYKIRPYEEGSVSIALA